MYDLTLLVLVPLFFAISFVYSSVGFGGGSSYTAILILAGISIFSVPPISLLLNIIVSCMAFLNYIKMAIIGIPIGALLGSVAGLIGIGGGIWLSPLLILTGLANPKQSAATASLFILTNSISGFAAHSISKPLDLYFLLPLACVVLAGGIIGSRLGAFRFDHDKIRMIIGAIVAVAAVNLTIKLLV